MIEELQLPSPIVEINVPNEKGVRVFVKRDDCIHEAISGNKWRKLKYQLQNIITSNKKGVLTFGGAFSNHIVATAAACRALQLSSVGIIRGDQSAEENPSLQLAMSAGMRLHFVSRTDYKAKEKSPAIQKILALYPESAIIAEGGHHERALVGMGEVIDELEHQIGIPDYLVCAVGTGTSFAGLASKCRQQIIGINVLKNQAVSRDICSLLNQQELLKNQVLLHQYHFGGYAKFTKELIDFMHQFYLDFKVKTDVIYTAKLAFALTDLLRQNYFAANSRVVMYHSGGLQGNAGMNYLHADLIRFE